MPHTWSIAVEIHFYIIIVCSIIILNKVGKANLFPLVVIFFIILCLLLRFNIAPIQFSLDSHVYPTHLRIDSLLFGSLIAYLKIFYPQVIKRLVPKTPYILFIPFVGLMSIIFSPLGSTVYTHTIGFTILSISFGILMIYLANYEFGPNWIIRILCFIGINSYPIYLFHIPIRDWLVAPHVDFSTSMISFLTYTVL